MPRWTWSFDDAFTVTRRSTGSPEPGRICRPAAGSTFAPTPASLQMLHRAQVPEEAEGRVGDAALDTARSMKVLSLIAPPPGLSAMSAITTGPPCTAIAACPAPRRPTAWASPVLSRRSQNSRPSSLGQPLRPARGRCRSPPTAWRPTRARRPTETMAQRHRQHAGPLLGLHALDEADHRFARGVPQAHHLAVEHGRGGPHAAGSGVQHDADSSFMRGPPSMCGYSLKQMMTSATRRISW
jgi:hypothetical protein